MKKLTRAIKSLIEERAQNMIANMEINILIDGRPVDCVREDRMGHIDLNVLSTDVEDILREYDEPDYDEPLTFAGTGCVRRIA